MTNTGHEERAAKIAENLKRRAQVTNTTEIVRDLDKSELSKIRVDLKNALEMIALEFQKEVAREMSDLEARWMPIMNKLNEAADAELERVQNGKDDD